MLFSRSAVIGTPDDLVKKIRELQEITGGFGVVLGFAHDWANREASMRSWELVARYVIPELNSYTSHLKASAEFLVAHQKELMDGRAASIMKVVQGNQRAEEALATTMRQLRGGGQTDFRPNVPVPSDDVAE